MRPRFRVPVARKAADVIADLDQRLKQQGCPCRGVVADKHRTAELRVPESERHFWSPTLSVMVRHAKEGEGSVVHGNIGPDPNVWTLFAMLYMGILTFLTGTAIFGLIQWWLDLNPWGLYFVPPLLIALVLMYVASRIGQKLAAPQAIVLREFLEDVVDPTGAGRESARADPYHR